MKALEYLNQVAVTLGSSHIDGSAAHSGFILGLIRYKQPFLCLTGIDISAQSHKHS